MVYGNYGYVPMVKYIFFFLFFTFHFAAGDISAGLKIFP